MSNEHILVCKCLKLDVETKIENRKENEDKKEKLEDSLEGVVVNETVALYSPCERIKGTNLYYSKGIVGALSKEQVDKYCRIGGIYEVEKPNIIERHKKWKEAVDKCLLKTKGLKGTEKLKTYLECMSEEMRKKE